MAKITKFFVFAALLVIVGALVWLDAFSHVGNIITDKLYGQHATVNRILIVSIDDASINALGRWPWDRDIHAKILEKLRSADVIGVDVSFFEESDNDQKLKTVLASMPNVVLAAEIQQGKLYTPIFPASYGYVNLLGDADGILRRFDPSVTVNAQPFTYRIAQLADPSLQLPSGIQRINFANVPGSFAHISAKDLLEQDLDFSGKIVLVGATAEDLHDAYFVPTSEGRAMPGVEIHANILQNILLGNFLNTPPLWVTLVVVFIIGAIGMFLLARIKVYYAIPLTIILLIAYAFASIIVFDGLHFILDLFYTPMTLLIFTGAGIGVNYAEEKKKGAYLREAFGKYVSKDLLSEILNKKQQLTLGGEKREVTVFFSDIRGFTSISETLAPEHLVHLLNEYFTAMTKIILAHKGTVDKFIGDAIMALWNAPLDEKDHALLACKSAVAQVSALKELQKSWSERGVPVLHIGCGIHTGPAIVGNLGSEERFDYTAVGDTINLASRMESLTKVYGVSILISESTYEKVKADFLCRKLDIVRVKGKTLPITLYHLCVSKDKPFVEAYEAALELYVQKKFKDALKAFDAAHKLRPGDQSCILFMERCDQYLKHPPPKDWDGVFTLTEK